MSRSVEHLNNDEKIKGSGVKEPLPSLASSSLTINSDSETGVTRRRFLFVKNRAFSTIETLVRHNEEGSSSIGGGSDGDRSSVTEPPKLGKKVSGYFKDLVSNVAVVKVVKVSSMTRINKDMVARQFYLLMLMVK